MLKKEKIITCVNLLICLPIVCILFIPTLNRPFLIYDERIIADGLFFPQANYFTEIFEIINKFGLNFNVSSSNSIYSSNYVTRTCPLATVFGILITFFFKRDPFSFHLFNLVLHLINTCLVFFILRFFLSNNKYLIPILTLIWAVHPVMMEPILLSINCGATFSYMFFFGFLLDFLINKDKNILFIRKLIIPFLFLIPMLINEYIVTLPFVLFIVSFYETYQNNSLKKAYKQSIKETSPYFIGLFFYIIFFLFFSHYKISHSFIENQFVVFFERIFWLSPQIFFHLLKLIFYPKILSIDQTLFVHFGKTLFDPYSVFCILFMAVWLLAPLFVFIQKKKMSSIFFLSWTFFFALLPFLHILMPSYTLATERYLYCPLALLIFGIGKILIKRASTRFVPTVTILLTIVLILCLIRSHYRTLDWKDNYSFINSTYKTSTDPLFKAVRLGMLGKAMSITESNNTEKSKKLFLKTIKLLKLAKEKTLENKLKYQDSLPLVIKSYGIDYDSILSKIAFLEASSRCLELNEDYKIGLKLLEPYVQNKEKLDPRILELYAHFLLEDKNYTKAKEILLGANSAYPHTTFILSKLADFSVNQEKDFVSAEKYLLEAIKFYAYDSAVLLQLVNFYQTQNNLPELAKYSYLFGLRTHARIGYEQALSVYLALGQIKEAQRIVKKLLKVDPNNSETLYYVSKYYYAIKDYQKSLSIIANAYELSKKTNKNKKITFEIGYTLSKFYLFLGNKQQADYIAKEILTTATGDKDLLSKLCFLYKSLELTQYYNLCMEQIK